MGKFFKLTSCLRTLETLLINNNTIEIQKTLCKLKVILMKLIYINRNMDAGSVPHLAIELTMNHK